jgi:subtilisin family serine protease
MNRGVLVSTVMLVSGVIALGCAGGMGDGDGGSDGADREKLRVDDRGLDRKKKRERKPNQAKLRKNEKKDEYIVKLAPGYDPEDLRNGKPKTGNKRLDEAFAKLDLKASSRVHERQAKHKKSAERLGLGRTIHIRTNKPKEEVMAKLEAHEGVEWVEAVTTVESAGMPNDPYFEHQWHMKELNVTEAWKITQGEGVVVAVVDTGVSANKDGYHKLLKGYDFIDMDSDASDENGHGSHVAGTIGQATDNGEGVAGVAPKVSILPVRVLGASGSGTNEGVAQGIIWAVDNGANIINLSLGSSVNSDVVEDACAYAYDNGVTVLAATGNDGFTDYIGYPAALPTTIAVGSVDAQRKVAFYSNQGKQIELVAPGGDTGADTNGDGLQDGVLQETQLNGEWAYHFLQGTSMATPHAAGVAALVYANGVTDPDEIREVLTSSADDLGDKGWDSVYGYGMVNPVAALQATPGRGGKGGKGRKGGKRPGGDGDLKIVKSRVQKKSEQRAVINWMTNQPAATFVRGSNGFERMIKDPSKIHKVAVTGKPGETVKFTFGSRTSKDNKVRDTVEITF